jgi:L-rhamnose mutarotase
MRTHAGGSKRERFLVYIRIFPGTEDEYDRRHREIWSEMVAALQVSGIRNYSGFRRGTDV